MKKIASLLSLLMLLCIFAFGQNRTVTGVVTGETGNPVAGASVKIKGTRTGVAADNNGKFQILTKAGDVLLITGTGIESAEVTVGCNNVIAISVKNAVTTGVEVVVTALGIKRQEKALGYGVSKVDPNSVLQNPNQMFYQALLAKYPV